MSRAETMAWRLAEAIATEALSMMRLTIIAATSFGDRDLVGGNAGDLPGELVLALQSGLRRADPDVMFNHYASPFVPGPRGQANLPAS